MASMHDLIEQIEDKRERERFRQVWEESIREKKFGLVFEPHLPELLPLPKVKPRRGDLVCMREGSLKDLWRVRRVANGVAFCVKPGAEGQGGPVDPLQFSLDELLVVRQFGEPIFPALVPVDQVQNGEAGAPWHTLIEADNFHALQLLDYLYAGKVDCIYIDPPYNTGARDWKYNNNYVDSNDGWRHSKWLAFMERRLKLAKRLLNPDKGVLVVTIDEHEVHHLGLLLEQEFPQAYRQLITIVITARGVAKQGLARVEEYAFFVYLGSASAAPTEDDFLTDKSQKKKKAPWASLLRRGTNASPKDRAGLVYPILVDPETKEILGVGETLADRVERGELQKSELNALDPPRTLREAWPIRSDGALGTWQVKPSKLMDLKKKGFVKIGRFDESRTSWSVNYLKRGPISEIERGELKIAGYEWEGGPAILEYADQDQGAGMRAKTVWHRTQHDAGTYGSSLLRSMLGARSFEFPKSLYAVRDTLATVVGNNPSALVVDFFAGSGTTLHALGLLNAADGGRRSCILVTNNEVSSADEIALLAEGTRPGDDAWEARGICRSVTWPRSRCAILGRKEDGTPLSGDYLTSDLAEVEVPRNFYHLGFGVLDTQTKKKQIVAMIPGLPQRLVTDGAGFIVSEEHKASLLFDESVAEEWLEALDGQDHITEFYIAAATKKSFEVAKARVNDLLGPQIVLEVAKRPMSAGFSENLAYFKLEFLDKDRVALKQAFREVLPMLWLKAGAVGPRPDLPRSAVEPSFFDPSGANFAVLLDEGAFRKFVRIIGKRTDLRVVYIVTDADEAFKDMADEVRQTLKLASPGVDVVQLYKDYLANFLINTRLDRGLNGNGGQP